MRVVRFGFDTPGMALRQDMWHRATMATVATYLGWQAFVGVLAFAALIDGNMQGACRLGPYCGIFAPMGDLLLMIVTIALMSVSVSVVQLLWKLLRALRRRAVWTGLACRVVGIATIVVGVFGFILGYGLPWIILGLLLAVAAQRMSVDAMDMGRSAPIDEGPPTGGARRPQSGPDNVIDVEFRDK